MLSKYLSIFPQFKNKIFYASIIRLIYPYLNQEKNKLRIKYNLPLNKKISYFSAQDIKDNRKGYKYFVKIKTNYLKKKIFFYFFR